MKPTIHAAFFSLLHTTVKNIASLKKIGHIFCLAIIPFITTAQEIKMYSGINLILNGNVNFVVNDIAFKNNGTFTPGTSTVSFTGNTDTIYAYVSGTSNTRFNNLTLNKSAYGVALKSAVSVKNTLAVSAGIVYANGNLTLLSDATGTARVAPGAQAGGYINGNVTVERFIPQNTYRAWRLLASPTSGQTINQAWQEGQSAGTNISPGYGTLITSKIASWQSNGFDYNTPNNSMYSYDKTSNALLPVLSTALSISAEPGYFIYIRGSRNIVPSVSITGADQTILRTKGSLYTGNQSAVSVPADKYALIGNPYASAIDIRNITTAGGCINTAFYVWDPKLAGSYNLGAYQTLTSSGADYIVVPGGGSYGSSGSITNTIQSGAAFFVYAVASTGSITINESSKTSGSSIVFRPGGNPAEKNIITNLYALNGGMQKLADGNMIFFKNSYSNNVDASDNKKMSNFGENLGIKNNTDELVIERRAMPVNDTINFSMNHLKKITYQLQILADHLNENGLSAFLEDRYLHNNLPVNLDDTTNYVFTVDTAAGSYDKNRFRIVFKSLTVLPPLFAAIKAFQINDKVQVDWKVQNEISTVKYDVEKSANGLDFTLVNTTGKNTSGNYSWQDAAAFAGKNFYRIKSTNRDGSIKYSEVVTVLMTKKVTNFTIANNPVKGNSISLHFVNQPKGSYQFNLINSAGQLVYSSKLQIRSSSTSQVLNMHSVLPDGIYQLQIAGPANTIETQKIIIRQ